MASEYILWYISMQRYIRTMHWAEERDVGSDVYHTKRSQIISSILNSIECTQIRLILCAKRLSYTNKYVRFLPDSDELFANRLSFAISTIYGFRRPKI